MAPTRWALDLDGVVWRGDEAIPGAAAAVARLDQAGAAVLFVTNFSASRPEAVEAKLARCGIDGRGRVVTSALAVATLVTAGERVLVLAGEGVAAAVADAGAVVVDASAAGAADGRDFDAVVVGYHRTFDYERLARACRAVWSGARLLATNDDRTYPVADGLLPGNGALVAAVEAATGATAMVAGKPHAPMAELVRARLGLGAAGGAVDDAVSRGGVMVGDRGDTDGAFATRLGVGFALVLSGVTRDPAEVVEPVPRWVAADLGALVAAVLDRPAAAADAR